MRNKLPFIISIAAALGVGALSALLSKGGMESYGAEVIQPPFSPPMWLFPMVWSALYILMGIGSAIVFINRNKNRSEAASALKLYGLQLIVNFFWSLIFFNMRAFLFAFVWLLLLLGLIVAVIYGFAKISKPAALIQIPYLAWVTFAGILTLAIYLLNR